MTLSGSVSETALSILRVARLAPSVHNTQPCVVKEGESGLVVSIDPAHKLSSGDLTGRQTIISLGIFVEALGIGAQSAGIEMASVQLRDNAAYVELRPSKDKEASYIKLIKALQHRCSDRSIYRSTTISSDLINQLQKATASPDVEVKVIDDESRIQEVAKLTSQGIAMALSNPAFRHELSRYLVLPWSMNKRGISVRSLYLPALVGFLQPWFIRLGLGLKYEAKLEKKRWESASAIIAITAAGDMPDYWLEVGRTYLRVSLTLEQAGLSQATSAALVEASNFHEDIEQMLGTKQRLLCMLRTGKGSPRRHYSPRVAAEDLLT